MKKINLLSLLIILIILSIVSEGFAEPLYLTSIPTNCNLVTDYLKKVATPKKFKISVLEAYGLAMKARGIIKPCASKLEQSIYFENKYYYFTNAVLVIKGQPFPTKFVRVNGLTGKTKGTF
jgi:hypothetical protein